LIWGHIDNQPITETEAGRTVSFNLKHKFVQVRVKISVSKISGATITNIGTVTIENQNTVDLTVQDGALSNYTNVGALDVSNPLTTGDNVTYLSDYYVFHPSPTRVNISSIEITVGGIPKTYSNLFATFTQGLTEAGNYTLAVDLEKFGFAGSNIYWDGYKLTFDKVRTWLYSSTYSDQYQGVYFRWGGLVGLDAYINDTYFVPPVNEGEEWEAILYAYDQAASRSGGSTSTATNVNYLYNNPNFTSYVGDICSFLTNGTWRMPNAAEFNSMIGGGYTVQGGGWNKGNVSGATEGRRFITCGLTFNTVAGSVFFPSTLAFDIYPSSPTNEGHYWTGTPNGSGKCYSMYIVNNIAQVVTSTLVSSGYGYSVRCIKI
jgi:hypothetical protein